MKNNNELFSAIWCSMFIFTLYAKTVQVKCGWNFQKSLRQFGKLFCRVKTMLERMHFLVIHFCTPQPCSEHGPLKENIFFNASFVLYVYYVPLSLLNIY